MMQRVHQKCYAVCFAITRARRVLMVLQRFKWRSYGVTGCFFLPFYCIPMICPTPNITVLK